MFDRESGIEIIRTEVTGLIIRNRNYGGKFVLRETARACRAAGLFQTIIAMSELHKVVEFGGSILNHDYARGYAYGNFFDKVLEDKYPYLLDKDIYMVMPTADSAKAIVLDLDNNIYRVVDLKKKSTTAKVLFELKIIESVPCEAIAGMLGKYMYVYRESDKPLSKSK